MSEINGHPVNATGLTEESYAGEQEIRYLCEGCKVLAVLLYSLLSILAFIGNCLVVAVIVYFRRLRTPTNMLIVNLALASVSITGHLSFLGIPPQLLTGV